MNKMFKVILLGALTATTGFVGCGSGEDIENQAVAGVPATTHAAGTAGTATVAAAGTAGATSSIAGAPSTTTTESAGSSSGCNVGHGATSRGALTGLAVALALAFGARRRRS
jgi:MYXO-CTERM domain-containing protein